MNPVLNERGIHQLPATPAEDDRIAVDPFITDITEVLALRLLRHQMPEAVFPHPRVLHKEIAGEQHRGIDIMGYEQSLRGTTLLIVEVMASASDQHPPTVVREHVEQILTETLNEQLPRRLLRDLTFVHDECGDPRHKEVLNGFIVAVADGSLKEADGQRAIAVLVRPLGMWFISDWAPFFNKTEEFDKARIPATVWFGAIECDGRFSALMDKIKDSAAFGSEEAR